MAFPVTNSLQLFTCVYVVIDSGSIQAHIWLAIELERFLPIKNSIFIKHVFFTFWTYNLFLLIEITDLKLSGPEFLSCYV